MEFMLGKEEFMKLENYEYIIETARCRSISIAAKKMYLSQSTLSSIINSTEKEIGYELFYRSSQGIVLTERGEEAVEIMEEICRNNRLIHELGTGNVKKRIRWVLINVYTCLSSFLSMELSGYLQSRDYDHIRLSVKKTDGCNVLSGLLHGEADMAIGHCSLEELERYRTMVKKAGFELHILFEDTDGCFLSAKSPFAGRNELDLNELSEYYMAVMQCCAHTHSLDVYDMLTKHISVFDSIDVIMQMVASGKYFTILPCNTMSLHREVRQGNIVSIPLKGRKKKIFSFIAVREEEKRSSAESRVLKDVMFFSKNIKK